jgi:hypothetical protein
MKGSEPRSPLTVTTKKAVEVDTKPITDLVGSLERQDSASTRNHISFIIAMEGIED